ncbi:methyltransferase domain-containing protein [Enterovirga sp.]|uniref:methyltransferase domain-containing protein n=1 Tax=Enterovirga sp. TaxID=2026350 RepID=UPI002BF922F9|nr:methyltransferase domain-containing protein [Enterovirga sp.]HMO29947.1 methyltransferase domain-containing protein [Enterovirga sp.]
MSNPRRDVRFKLHRNHFSEHVDFSRTVGLEIGAFDLPLVEPHEGVCFFADYNDATYLRREATRIPGHNPDFVVEIQYDLKQGYDNIPQHDWVSGSHVIEHVPDLLGWFQSLRSVLKDGGRCLLVVPDKRYIFDVHRTVSSLADVMDAHEARRVRPSFRNVLDHHLNAVPYSASDGWAGVPPPSRPRNFQGALALARRAENEYVDAHCWVFTPESFQVLVEELSFNKLLPFSLLDLRPTAPGMIDFSAVLAAQ